MLALLGGAAAGVPSALRPPLLETVKAIYLDSRGSARWRPMGAAALSRLVHRHLDPRARGRRRPTAAEDDGPSRTGPPDTSKDATERSS
jgi:hypothetical protein